MTFISLGYFFGEGWARAGEKAQIGILVAVAFLLAAAYFWVRRRGAARA